jgi:hypothetical protein
VFGRIRRAKPPSTKPLPLTHSFRFGWWNERGVPATLFVERWGEDYTAPPGGRLELVVRATSPDLWFNVVSHEDGGVQVYVEGEAPRLGPVEWEVTLDATPIECGHNRHLCSRLASRPPV